MVIMVPTAVLLKIPEFWAVALREGTVILQGVGMFSPGNRVSNPRRLELTILNMLSEDSVLFLIAVCSPSPSG
jgi:hypothetical protein